MIARLAVLSLLAVPLAAQAPLPIGSKASGTTSSEAPAEFRFTPPSAGVLTIVVRGNDDLTIQVVDEDGQLVPMGTADGDNNGSTGLEYLAVPIGQADPLRVRVTLLSDDGGSGAFTISAAFLAEEGFAQAADPDRRPSLARALTVGGAMEESLNPEEGDRWDWFVIRASEAMTVTVLTRMDEGSTGDLVLSAFTGGNMDAEIAHSDQDLQGHLGNESVTVALKAGDVLHIKVASLQDSGGAAPYRISVGRMP
jgi:hypothetical protein